MSVVPAPLERLVFEARDLMETYEPHWRHDHKALVYEVACPPGSVWQGRLRYTRWAALPLPEEVDPASAAARVEPCRRTGAGRTGITLRGETLLLNDVGMLRPNVKDEMR